MTNLRINTVFEGACSERSKSLRDVNLFAIIWLVFCPLNFGKFKLNCAPFMNQRIHHTQSALASDFQLAIESTHSPLYSIRTHKCSKDTHHR